jgi:hypothetical protein
MPAAQPADTRGATGPLSEAEVMLLDGTLLPALERHHLRLLAHALRTLQQVRQSQGGHDGGLPQPAAIEQWLLQQPGVAGDAGFARHLAWQLHHAGQQLVHVAAAEGLEPLALDLEQLTAWAQHQADERVIRPPHTPHQEPPAGPPTHR